MNEFCLANLTIGNAGPLELLDLAAAGDFDSVNCWLAPPPAMAEFARKPRRPETLIGNAALLRAFRKRSTATGITVFAASCGWVNAAFRPADIDAVLDTVEAIGGRNIALVGWDDDRTRLLEHLGAVAEAADVRRIGVNLEFMPYSAVRTLADAMTILARLPANARLIIDALHLARSGGSPADVAAVAPERIASVQLCDAVRNAPPGDRLRDESVNDRRLPGEGDLPLRELLAALPPGVVIEVEAPVSVWSDLDPMSFARLVSERTRAFLGRP